MTANVTIDFNANLARFTNALDKATNDLNKFQTNADRMSKNVNRAFKSLAVVVPSGLLVNFAKGVIDAADNLKDLSERTGVSIETLAGLKAVAEKSGASVEDLATGMKYLAKNIEEAKSGNKEMAHILEQMGVKGSDLKEDFFALADSMSKSKDGQGKLALSMTLLGRSGEALIPTLNQGGAALRQLDAASSGYAKSMAELAPAADEFNDSMTDLKNSISAAAAVAMPGLLNKTVELINQFTIGIRTAGGFAEAIRLFGFGLSPFKSTQKSLDELAKRMLVIQQQLNIANEKGDTKTKANLESERADVIKKIKYLQDLYAAKNYKLPEEKKSNTELSVVAEGKCLQSGGVWDGKRCYKPPEKGSKEKAKDTLGIDNLISQTSTERIAKVDAQIAALTDRFQQGKIGPEVYKEAMVGLNAELEKIKQTKDAFGDGSFISADPATIEMIRQQQEAINDLNGSIAEDKQQQAEDFKSALDGLVADTTVAKTQRLYKNVEILDKAFFDGVIGIDQYNEAMKNLTEDTSKELKDTKSIGEELGLTFSSAFEDAMISGKKFRDVISGIAQDIQRMILRRTITEPLGNAVSGVLGGIDWGALWPFAGGGIMTSNGPVPIRKYAGGGIANTPQAAIFAEGSVPEAFVPVPNGKIPVEIKGNSSGGGGVVLNQNINVDARGADSGVDQKIRKAVAEGARQGYAMVVSDLSRGGTVARLAGVA